MKSLKKFLDDKIHHKQFTKDSPMMSVKAYNVYHKSFNVMLLSPKSLDKQGHKELESYINDALKRRKHIVNSVSFLDLNRDGLFVSSRLQPLYNIQLKKK